MSSFIGTNADWYLMRASGFVALVLLTVTVVLGISNVGRLARAGWTRAVAALVHRNVSLLAVVFLAVHVLTAISDKYVKIPALAIVVPGLSGYDPFWVGLGALAVDLIVAVTVTSLVRSRLQPRAWRLVHWLTYVSWPVALVHSIGSGTGRGIDTGHEWSTLIYVALGLTFAGAVGTRLALAHRPTAAGRPIPARYLSRRSA